MGPKQVPPISNMFSGKRVYGGTTPTCSSQCNRQMTRVVSGGASLCLLLPPTDILTILHTLLCPSIRLLVPFCRSVKIGTQFWTSRLVFRINVPWSGGKGKYLGISRDIPREVFQILL
jgi:hypothetical protein